MITFKMDFDPDDFMKSMIAQLEEGFRRQLEEGGVKDATLTFTLDSKNEVQASLSGTVEEVEKARTILGI